LLIIALAKGRSGNAANKGLYISLLHKDLGGLYISLLHKDLGGLYISLLHKDLGV